MVNAGTEKSNALLDPLENRGVAFSLEERKRLGLTGRLPSAVFTLDQQAERAYAQLHQQPDDLAENMASQALHFLETHSVTSRVALNAGPIRLSGL